MDAESHISAAADDSRQRRGVGWRLRFGPMLLAASLTAYLQLRADPSLSSVPHVPHAWITFFDGHDFFKNLVGFGGLAATVHFAFAGFGRESWRSVLRRAAWLGVMVVCLELAQLYIPTRSCDWHDVAAGWLGIAMASLLWGGGADALIQDGK